MHTRIALLLRRAAQRAERRAHLVAEYLGLLPSGEMATPICSVEVDELWIRPLRPASWCLEALAGKRGHCCRDGDPCGQVQVDLVLPIEARRRDGRVGQPVKHYIIEHVGQCQVARRMPAD